jgi:hypothetical protein
MENLANKETLNMEALATKENLNNPRKCLCHRKGTWAKQLNIP